MQHSPLIHTLSLLDQDEFETLRLFVESPLFNSVNRYHDTVALFEYLRAYYPGFVDTALEKDAVASALFPDRKNGKSEVEKAMAHLMRVVKQFITFKYFASKGTKSRKKDVEQVGTVNDLLNSSRQQLAQMRFHSERSHLKSISDTSGSPNTYQHFMSMYEALKTDLKSKHDISQFEEYEFNDLLYHEFLLEWERAQVEGTQERIGSDRNLMNAIESLDRYYLYTKLDLMSRLVHHVNQENPFEENSTEHLKLNNNRDITLMILKNLKEQDYFQQPVIRMYTELLNCLTDPDPDKADAAAESLETLLLSVSQDTTESRRRDYYSILRSYWARRSRRSQDPQHKKKLFELQKLQLIEVSPTEKIPARQLYNILRIAISLGLINDAEQMLNDLGGRIGVTGHPHIIRSLFWSVLRFSQSKWQEAAATLPHYYVYGDLDDIIFYSIAATLDVKIGYELNLLGDEGPSNMMRATSTRIKRDKTLAREARKERERFFPLAAALFRKKERIRMKKNVQPDDLQDLKTEILSTPTVEREWLLEKLQELNLMIKQ
jgi:hypothetical protein